ncbi:MAG TPA: hypothetical protein VNN73_07260 [Blastocatellia bacterium]|nr:hypothetical protein [Blastocatellia bacterium]
MRSRFYLLLLALAIVLASAFNWSEHGQTTSRTVYEYKVMFDANANNEKKLNEMATQGWELVAIRTVVFQGNDTGGYYYFKRAK